MNTIIHGCFLYTFHKIPSTELYTESFPLKDLIHYYKILV